MNFDARSISPTCDRQIGWWFFYSCLISLTCDRQIGWWISTPVRSLRLVTERSDNNFLSLTLTLSVTDRRTDEFRRLGPTDIFWRPFDQRCLRRTDRLVHFEPIWSTMPVKVWLTDEFYFLSWSTMPVTDQLMNFAALSIYLWPTDRPMNFDAWSIYLPLLKTSLHYPSSSWLINLNVILTFHILYRVSVSVHSPSLAAVSYISSRVLTLISTHSIYDPYDRETTDEFRRPFEIWCISFIS